MKKFTTKEILDISPKSMAKFIEYSVLNKEREVFEECLSRVNLGIQIVKVVKGNKNSQETQRIGHLNIRPSDGVQSPLIYYVYENALEYFDIILDMGVGKLDFFNYNYDKMTLATFLANKGDIDRFERVLVEHPYLLTKLNNSECSTLFHIACSLGSIELLESLMKIGNYSEAALISKLTDRSGSAIFSPIEVAVCDNRIELLQYIKDNHLLGTDDNRLKIMNSAIRSKEADNNYKKQAPNGNKYLAHADDFSILDIATYNSNMETVNYLMNEYGCKLNAKIENNNFQTSVVMCAIAVDDFEKFKYWIDKGATIYPIFNVSIDGKKLKVNLDGVHYNDFPEMIRRNIVEVDKGGVILSENPVFSLDDEQIYKIVDSWVNEKNKNSLMDIVNTIFHYTKDSVQYLEHISQRFGYDKHIQVYLENEEIKDSKGKRNINDEYLRKKSILESVLLYSQMNIGESKKVKSLKI